MVAKKILVCFLLSLLFSVNLYASGAVKGTVIDAVTGEALYGANIFLIGTSLGSATDFEGTYRISNVPSGTYELKASYIGYKDSIVNVIIEDNRTLLIDFQLRLDVIEGEDVVVTAQAQGQLAAINQQLSSNTIKNVVSSEKILEVPDVNAAESIGRLPGVSIIRSGGEASKVAIRGLSPTYNTVTIGGERIPATDVSDRSVDLSMISPEILKGIEVTKAITPDQDADAIGGSINLTLNDAPSGFRYHFRAASGYNHLRDDFGQYNGSLTLSNRFADELLGLMVTANRNRVLRSSDRFNSSYYRVRDAHEDEIYDPVNAQSPRLDYTSEIRERTSFSVFMDYKLPNGKLKFNNFISRLDREQDRSRLSYTNSDFEPRFYRTIRQTDVLTTSFSGEHEFSFGDFDWRVSRNFSASRTPYDAFFRFLGGNVATADLPNEYRTAEQIINVTTYDVKDVGMFAGNSFITSELTERDFTGQFNFKLPYTINDKMSGYLKLGAKIYNKRREYDYSNKREDYNALRLDTLVQTFHSSWGEPGFIYEKGISGTPSLSNFLIDDEIGEFFGGEYNFPILFNGNEITRLLDKYTLDNLYLREIQGDIQDYKTDEAVSSAYIMSEFNFANLMILPGIRYEHTKNEMQAVNGKFRGDPLDPITEEASNFLRDTTGTSSYENWFPMIHLRYKPFGWTDVRFAYTKTIARPRLGQLLPRVRVDAQNDEVEMGSTDLKPQLSTNYDLFLSFYGNDIGLFTLGGFYKEIDNLILTRENRSVLNEEHERELGLNRSIVRNVEFRYTLTKPENIKDLTVIKGFEIEWQTNLHWLPSPFNGIVISANYTHLTSETNYPKSGYPRINGRPTLVDTFRTGRMPNQADDIVNVTLGYDYSNFSGRVSMLYQGKTLDEVADEAQFDTYTKDLLRFDLSLKYNLTDKISLFLNANNITNEPDESFLFGFGDPNDFPTSRQLYGYTIDLGIGIRN